MRNEVAPVALQESVVELPAVIVLGEAEKEEMVGAEVVCVSVCLLPEHDIVARVAGPTKPYPVVSGEPEETMP